MLRRIHIAEYAIELVDELGLTAVWHEDLVLNNAAEFLSIIEIIDWAVEEASRVR